MTKSTTIDYYDVASEVKHNSLVFDQHKFDLLKNKLSFAINSTRALYYIRNYEELIDTMKTRALAEPEKEESLKLILECIKSSKACESRTGNQLPFHVLDMIAEEIGRRWLDMARHLDVSEGTISEIEAKYQFSLKQQAYQALLTFCKEVDNKRIQSKLLDALSKTRRVDLRTKVERELYKENRTKKNIDH